MMTKSLYLPNEKLIVEVIREKVTYDLLISMRTFEIGSGWVSPGANTLVAIMTDDFGLDRSDLEAYGEWSVKNLSALKGSQTAILVDTPVLTALSVLLKDVLAAIRSMEIFSTLDHASAWLGVQKSSILEIAPELESFDNSLPRL